MDLQSSTQSHGRRMNRQNFGKCYINLTIDECITSRPVGNDRSPGNAHNAVRFKV